MNSLASDAAASVLETADIGGTSASTPWVSLAGYDRLYAAVVLGTTFTDALTTCQLEQATSAGGANAKALTTSGAGASYDYNSSAALDAPGDTAILEARSEDLDVDGGFSFVRLTVGATADTGVDLVTAFLLRYSAAHGGAEKQGAASDSLVYVRPS